MTNPGPGDNYTRYEVIMQEDPETGDFFVPIPPHLLTSLGWKEGDTVDFTLDDEGRFVLKKIDKPT